MKRGQLCVANTRTAFAAATTTSLLQSGGGSAMMSSSRTPDIADALDGWNRPAADESEENQIVIESCATLGI